MSDYTPTTEEVVCLYPANEAAHLLLDGTWHHMNKWEFGRWLAEVKAQVWADGYTAGTHDWRTESLTSPNPYRQGEQE